MGCDLINQSGKELEIIITDYDTGVDIFRTTIDITDHKIISYEVSGDGVIEI